MTDEYRWIKSYLDGEADWERLVNEVGEDMARGVRIAENYLKEDKNIGTVIFRTEDCEILHREKDK